MHMHSFKLLCPTPGGVLWYFHIYVGSAYFLGSKFWISILFWEFQKNEYFLGYEDFVDIFFGSSQNWASLRVISMQFRVFFLRPRYRIGIFLGLLKFQIFFWGAWNSWYFLGWTVDAGSEPTYAEKIRVPPPWVSNGLEMPLQGNSFYDLTITLGSRSHKMKLSTYVTYTATKFEFAMSNRLGRDTFSVVRLVPRARHCRIPTILPSMSLKITHPALP